MSTEITTAFVQEYTDGITLLAQQEMSRLRNEGVVVDSGVVGKSVYMDQIGVRGRMQNMTTRHGDTVQTDTPHSRRKIDLIDKTTVEYLDIFDKVRVLNQPDSSYVRVMSAQVGREIDHIIYDAAIGTSYTGEAGGTSVTLPSSQIVAVDSHAYGAGSGNAGLTVSKLIEANNILKKNEALSNGEMARIIVNADAISDLLQTVEVTSAEYNQVRALQNGEIDVFMGFKFIHTEIVKADANSYDQIVCYTDNAVGLGIGMEPQGRISERPDKNYLWQIWYGMSMGATRLEEKRVVKILCA